MNRDNNCKNTLFRSQVTSIHCLIILSAIRTKSMRMRHINPPTSGRRPEDMVRMYILILGLLGIQIHQVALSILKGLAVLCEVLSNVDCPFGQVVREWSSDMADQRFDTRSGHI